MKRQMNGMGPIEPGVDADARSRLRGMGVPTSLPLPRWFAVLATVCALGLVPWIVYLAFSLPAESRSEHYAVAWVGFDTAMFVVLSGLAVAAIRRSTWTEPLATCSATLLVMDSWFDIVTASGQMHRVEAILSAAIVELPLAFLCAWVALNTEQFRRTAFRRLAGRVLSFYPDGRSANSEIDSDGSPLEQGEHRP
ncbi:MAG: hypothetical protein JWM76_2343 [Pseudonocardiales bacterium]|jgi:hypothetical protein|nr:hypothetical protein [Pseudonocardiales bacterium]